MSMRIAGTICWALEIIVVLAYLYVGREKVSKQSLILKEIASAGPILYASLLINMSGHLSRGAAMFVGALVLYWLGDFVTAYLPMVHGGTIKSFYGETYREKGTGLTIWLGTGCIAIIVSYFMQMVVFLNRLRDAGELTQYAIFFLIIFLVPLLLIAIGLPLTGFEIPEVTTRLFIIGIFYALLTSALFATTIVFSAWFMQFDRNHALFIAMGGVTFLLSALIMGLRYSDFKKYDTKELRIISRSLIYLSRMILAGCAFLF